MTVRHSIAGWQALDIATRRTAGERGIDLAAEYGISPQLVCDIFNGRRHMGAQAPCGRPLAAWRSSEREGKTYTVSIARCDGKHLTDEDYAWMRERLGMRPDDDVLGREEK